MGSSATPSPERAFGRLTLWPVWMQGASQRGPGAARMRTRDLACLCRNLATLLENGLPLAKAISVLTRERALKRHWATIEDLRRHVEGGGAFSSAIAAYPQSFSAPVVCQIRGGERSGALAGALDRLAGQLESSHEIRSQIRRKLAYPAFLLAAGCAAVTFMILFVIPVFDGVYREAKVPLPWITRALIAVADFATAYGWIAAAGAALAAAAIRASRRSPASALALDRLILKTPVVGDWLRNIAVLQVMEVFGNLIESGFKVVDSLETARGATRNRAIATCLADLESAVRRGERFSREIDNLGELFPPVVGQLIVVGEKTGKLSQATAAIRAHLRRDIEQQTRLLVGVIEPVLTISLAAMIGVVLLAIYLPMFDMIGAMNAH